VSAIRVGRYFNIAIVKEAVVDPVVESTLV